jgi:hypothetical protein
MRISLKLSNRSFAKGEKMKNDFFRSREFKWIQAVMFPIVLVAAIIFWAASDAPATELENASAQVTFMVHVTQDISNKKELYCKPSIFYPGLLECSTSKQN